MINNSRSINWPQTIVYLILAGFMGFFVYQQQSFNRDRCESSNSSRAAIRDTVNAVGDLAIGVTVRGADAPPRTTEEEARLKRYLGKVDRFRKETLTKVQPTAECSKYGVEDIN